MSRGNNIRSRQGLTLVELLIAITITVTLLTGIFALFFSVMQTVSRGFMVQQGFELGRGTLAVIQRDLNNAHTSRSTGETLTFVGTPIGFSFIASLDNNPTNSDSLSRVTYVIHQDSNEPIPMDNVDDPATVEDESLTSETVNVVTFSLIRFVERGVSDLDSHGFFIGGAPEPVGWVDAIDPPGGEAPPPEWDQVAAELNDITDTSKNGLTYVSYIEDLGDDSFGSFDAEGNRIPLEFEQLLEAKKRELFIRMLAGDPALPNAFARTDDDGNVIQPGFLRTGNGDPVLWQDFVVAENIAFLPESVVNADSPFINPVAPLGARPIVFVYGTTRNVVANESDPTPVNYFNRFWNTQYNVIDLPGVSNTFEDPFQDNIAVQLFTSTNDFTGTPIQPLVTNNADDFLQLIRAIDLGSPLNARLPELVGVTTPINIRSTFTGVPDFDKSFQQLMKVPAAAKRKVNDIIHTDTNTNRDEFFPGT